MAYVISVCNQKGGVAKTTTCLSLGACLAEMDRRILLVDLDPQANLTVSLALQPESLNPTIAQALLGKATAIAVRQRTGVPGLDILPANAAMAAVERALYRRRAYEGLLHKALAGMDPALYDYILVDCPPSVGPLTLNALTAADLLIIPTQAEYYALRSLLNVFALIKLVRRKTNPALRYRIVVTMFDRRNSIHVTMLDHIRNQYQDLLLNTVIDVDTRIRESPLRGVPITRVKSARRSTQQYRALAEEVIAL